MLLPDNVVHYFSGSKNAHHGEAIIKGFGAKRVPVEEKRLWGGAFHILGGLQFGSLELMVQLRAEPQPYLFVDRAYFGGGPGTDMMRIVPSAYQHHWMQKDRGQRLKPVLFQDFKRGDKIMVVPPGPAICVLFDLGDWLSDTLTTLSQITDRQVFVSVKGDRRPLMERLKQCHAVVTWTSNVAVDAVCAGVPAFVSHHSAAAPVASAVEAMTDESLADPYFPDEHARLAWANGLTWGQFSVAEVASGYAKEVLDDSGRA